MSKKVAGYVRVSTDEQKDKGHSIDAQIRIIREYCDKNDDYTLIEIYNDAGYSGKNLNRPAIQRLFKDIESQKIDVVVALKIDRLSRENLDSQLVKKHCIDNDCEIILINENYDLNTLSGNMMYGIASLFAEHERKEIGLRTKRGLEEMVLQKKHPNRAPFGYVINKETGHLEINPIESVTVKEVFDLCAKGYSTRGIATFMKENNRYLQRGKWESDRVYNILKNPVYIGTYHHRSKKGKPEDIIIVEDYCEPIIDMNTWKRTRATLEKNKHPNYGEHIHLFTAIVKCPECNKIMSSTLSYKYNKDKTEKQDYYFLTCKNYACKSKGLHYNCDKIERKLVRVLNELVAYMFNTDNEIVTCSNNKSDEIKNINKAIDKLKVQEERLVDLYINSNLNADVINKKNDKIKKEIANLNTKKADMFPDNDDREYTIELLKKLEHTRDGEDILFHNKIALSPIFDSLTKKSKQQLIARCIATLEIKRIENKDIEITNIKFTDELISKSYTEYVEYLNLLLVNNNMGVHYKEHINKKQCEELSKANIIISGANKNFKSEWNKYYDLICEHLITDGIIYCPYVEDNAIVDYVYIFPQKRPLLEVNNV